MHGRCIRHYDAVFVCMQASELEYGMGGMVGVAQLPGGSAHHHRIILATSLWHLLAPANSEIPNLGP